MRLSSRSWTATCNGRRYLCGELRTGSNNARQVNCAATEPDRVVVIQREPARSATAGGERPATATATPASSDVQRTVRDGVAYLRVDVAVGSTHLLLAAAPARDANRVWFAMRVPGAEGEHRACTTGIILDGTPRPLTLERYDYQAPNEELRFIMTVDELRALATASRVAGRVCDAEWRLDDEARHRLVEFVARFDEEAAWQHSSAAPTAP